MVITREQLVKYWCSEPHREYREGYINLTELPFPDLAELTPEERALLTPVLERNPQYLLEVPVNAKVIQ